MKKEIYLVRHAQTDYNKKKIVQGRGVNSDINETGRKQAQLFYEQHQKTTFDRIYVSHLKRTHQTMGPFVEHQNHTLLPSDHIDEIDWGVHEGKSPDPVMREDYRRILNAWATGEYDVAVEKGESPLKVQKRLNAFFTENFMQEDWQRIMICTHGRILRILLCTLLKKELKEMQTFSHSNLILYKVDWEAGNFQIDFVNELPIIDG